MPLSLPLQLYLLMHSPSMIMDSNLAFLWAASSDQTLHQYGIESD
jgi:hypothetical protein